MRYSILIAAIVAALLTPTVYAQNYSGANRTKARYSFGRILYFDNATGLETILPFAPITFYDEFIGNELDKYVSGEDTGAIWKTTETNLNTGIGLVDDGLNGLAQITLDVDDNAEVGALYWGDNVCLDGSLYIVFEARLMFTVLPVTGTETVQAVWGLAGAHNTVCDSVDNHAWFRVESSANTALLWETDDNVTNDDDNDASTTLVASTYHVYRIEMLNDGADVNFYVDGTLVGEGAMAGMTGAYGKFQPYFCLSKAKSSANTGRAIMHIDYVRVWAERQ